MCAFIRIMEIFNRFNTRKTFNHRNILFYIRFTSLSIAIMQSHLFWPELKEWDWEEDRVTTGRDCRQRTNGKYIKKITPSTHTNKIPISNENQLVFHFSHCKLFILAALVCAYWRKVLLDSLVAWYIFIDRTIGWIRLLLAQETDWKVQTHLWKWRAKKWFSHTYTHTHILQMERFHCATMGKGIMATFSKENMNERDS